MKNKDVDRLVEHLHEKESEEGDGVVLIGVFGVDEQLDPALRRRRRSFLQPPDAVQEMKPKSRVQMPLQTRQRLHQRRLLLIHRGRGGGGGGRGGGGDVVGGGR